MMALNRAKRGRSEYYFRWFDADGECLDITFLDVGEDAALLNRPDRWGDEVAFVEYGRRDYSGSMGWPEHDDTVLAIRGILHPENEDNYTADQIRMGGVTIGTGITLTRNGTDQ